MTQLTLEPDRAQVYALNLIRARRKFVLEVDPRAKDRDGGSLKDVVCLAIGGEFVRRDDRHYVEMNLANVDDARQFAVNCLKDEISFEVTPIEHPGGRPEWKFVAERAK